MKINIEMEAWELATVIKGLTINAQPGEKDPSGTEKIKPILSDKTREELKNAIANAIANAFKVPEKVTTLPQKTESKESCSVSKDTLDAFGALLRQRLKINEILDESKHREDNPNPNYRPPMGGSHQ
nr:hypothetical protein [uncultured Ruminococcus sp.]